MASDVEIANLALAHLGDKATVASLDPPEGSAQAEHCARFYPIARDTLLEMHAWKFCTRRATLAQLDVDTFDWQFAYAEPSGALKILAVLQSADSSGNDGHPFETEGDADGRALIRTDVEDAVVRYIARVTDTTKFSPLFVDALAWLLASYLAGPVIKGDQGMAVAKNCYQSFLVAFSRATMADSNQRKVEPGHSPDWMTARA